ncbi:hypothetical protein SAMN05216360_11056 [Methylobacterium phyllostachyos]|uniref:Uncharacterized protein n=1 Tax=Methylobacterium phyllostachyos TaxID=582672 RepID=A0A1H0D892_9HYPH|nr:hypothetical protein SAMN05216360_11056 [Methylobacterium phyllostachyos]
MPLLRKRSPEPPHPRIGDDGGEDVAGDAQRRPRYAVTAWVVAPARRWPPARSAGDRPATPPEPTGSGTARTPPARRRAASPRRCPARRTRLRGRRPGPPTQSRRPQGSYPRGRRAGQERAPDRAGLDPPAECPTRSARHPPLLHRPPFRPGRGLNRGWPYIPASRFVAVPGLRVAEDRLAKCRLDRTSLSPADHERDHWSCRADDRGGLRDIDAGCRRNGAGTAGRPRRRAGLEPMYRRGRA